jgi:hypothetical protein
VRGAGEHPDSGGVPGQAFVQADDHHPAARRAAAPKWACQGVIRLGPNGPPDAGTPTIVSARGGARWDTRAGVSCVYLGMALGHGTGVFACLWR